MKSLSSFLFTSAVLVASAPSLLAVTPEQLENLVNRSPIPSAGDYEAIIAIGDRFVAATNYGEIITSTPDATRWSPLVSVPGVRSSNPPQALASNGTRTLLTTFGDYYVSDDLETWSEGERFEFGGGSLGLDATYGAGRFVAVGRSGGIGWSTDATTWTQASSIPVSTNLEGVAFGNGVYVAGGAEGHLLRSTDGDSWTLTFDGIPGATGSSNSFASVSFANGLFFAGAFGALYTSPDGTTWTARDFAASGVSGTPISVVHDGTRYVISTSFGGAATTTDFTTYTEPTRGDFARIGPLAALGETVATGGTFFAYIGTLAAGTDTWIQRTARLGGGFDSVVFEGSRFVLTEASAGRIFTSGTGASWTLAYQAPEGVGIRSEIAQGPTRTVVLTDDRGVVSSTDGTNWTFTSFAQTISTPSADIRYVGSLYTIFGRGGSLYSSTDGLNYTPATIDTEFWPSDIAFGDGLYVAVGNDGDAFSSPDFTTWTRRITGTEGSRLSSIEHAGGRFIAFGGSSPTTSPDGITWTLDTTAANAFASKTTLDPDLGIVSLGLQQRFIHYPDPSDLSVTSTAPFPSALTANALAEGNGVVVVAGSAGLLLSTGSDTAGYEAWVLDNFPLGAPNTGPADDFDADSQPNLAEYARDTDPTTFTAAFIAPPEQTAFGPEITFTQRSADLSLATTVEFSTDLTTWQTTGVLQETAPAGPGIERITARVTGPAGQQSPLYMRARWTIE